MKTLKRALVSVLAIIMMMSIMTIPASAAVDPHFYHFPLVTKSMGNGYMSAAVAVQKFLMLYDPICYTEISKNGGTDGYFGPGSANAAIRFQRQEGLGVDGKVGSLTWMKICELLTEVSGIDSYAPYYCHPDNSNNNVGNTQVIFKYNGYSSVDRSGRIREVFYLP